ncbi:MAG: hypothetical protein ACXIUP_09680 [Microcella sp.]
MITKTTTAPLIALLCAATLALAGCAGGSPAPVIDDSANVDASTDTAPPEEPAAGDADAPADEPSSSSDEVTVIGGDLVDDLFVRVAAEQYAKGRTPVPTVEFTSATDVTFSFDTTLDEVTLIGNCQIAYGVLDAEGVSVTIVDGSGTLDCTAFIRD